MIIAFQFTLDDQHEEEFKNMCDGLDMSIDETMKLILTSGYHTTKALLRKSRIMEANEELEIFREINFEPLMQKLYLDSFINTIEVKTVDHGSCTLFQKIILWVQSYVEWRNSILKVLLIRLKRGRVK